MRFDTKHLWQVLITGQRQAKKKVLMLKPSPFRVLVRVECVYQRKKQLLSTVLHWECKIPYHL